MSVSVVLAEQVLNLVNHLGFEGGFEMIMMTGQSTFGIERLAKRFRIQAGR